MLATWVRKPLCEGCLFQKLQREPMACPHMQVVTMALSRLSALILQATASRHNDLPDHCLLSTCLAFLCSKLYLSPALYFVKIKGSELSGPTQKSLPHLNLGHQLKPWCPQSLLFLHKQSHRGSLVSSISV